jgi:DNA-directed RNA polymerase specialized sigma24 family protein
MAAMEAAPTDDALIEELYPSLYRFAAVVAPRGDDPDDLVQDAFVRTLARHPLADLDLPHAYLRRTILNLANNRRRSLRRQLGALTRLGRPLPIDDSYPSDVAALLDLAPQTRAVLWLADVEGLGFDEIADQLGLTATAARQRASRGRAEIRTRLEEEQFDADARPKGMAP